MPAGTDGFIADVLQNRFNRTILKRLSGLHLPDAWLVAGCLFQTVWNLRSGQAAEAGIRDYDIFYFDGNDLSAAAEDRVNQRAALLFADLSVPLEIKNQARVHTWYQDYFGRPYTALGGSCEGIDRFLVACTSVGIRASSDPAGDGFEVYAPHGLDDLYHGVLSPNPTLDHGALFEPKCRDYQVRWPWLTIRANTRK
ncbi:MAG: nucleotidyltransferase family protein [Rhodoferax sp.]|nr:nucleotidyltransferase family protein [Rhodoferax sp.]